MTSKLSQPARPRGSDIKRVPQDAAVREAIRAAAAELAVGLDRARVLARQDLELHAGDILQRLDLPQSFLGFVMVAVNNAFWLPIVEGIPFTRRLFLLPHCLSDRTVCAGVYDSVGLHCAGCGSCDIHSLKSKAEQLGYSVIVAEGTSSVLFKVLEGDADAIFGVACLDSLERSFQRVVELGVPHLAVPLLKDGCLNTEVEIDQIRTLLAVHAASSIAAPSTGLPRNYVGLLRETGRLFHSELFFELLSSCIDARETAEHAKNGAPAVQDIAFRWLQEGGKRLRPFVTLAAYAVAKHGAAVLDGCDAWADKLPLSIRRLALAIEALHKASLVHDDIEDNDDYRYGQPTLHRVYGVAQTINVGDFLIGLGYRLMAGEMATLGAACTGDIVNQLSRAHLELCRGQGAELQYVREPQLLGGPAAAMKVAAQKTAPAFEVALYAGLRAADVTVAPGVLRRFATYLGEGFQIHNDLDDWQEDKHNKRKRGLDASAGRPTILHVFAAESGQGARLAELIRALQCDPTDELSDQVYDLYRQCGAFTKVEQLYQRLRDRALATAAEFPTHDLQDLMRFLVRIILPEPTEDAATAP